MANKGPEMDLSSFTDIMTCILGVLILIVLMTGIDASQITVLVATPKEMTGDDKRPVFFECRNNQLFQISFDEMKQACAAKTEELREMVKGDETEFLKQAAQTIIELNGLRLDYTYSLLGKYVLTPIPGAKGYEFVHYLQETDQMWFGSRLAKINPESEFICFFVRPDSYTVFQKARGLAWRNNVMAACELLDEKDPIMIGAGGKQVFGQ